VLGALGGGVVVHVLGPDELQPTLSGDLTLRDSETHEEVRVSLSSAALERYRTRSSTFVAEARRRARRAGLDHVLVTAGPDSVDRALRDLVGEGWVR
jgi:hypothetical protein